MVVEHRDQDGELPEQLTQAHSLGWVTARSAGELVGFVNVVWDGLVHAWLQDVMVAARAGRQGWLGRFFSRVSPF